MPSASAKLISLLLIASATPSIAKENLRITFSGEALSVGARQALAEALAPSSPYAALTELANTPGAALASESLIDGYQARNAANNVLNAYRNTQPENSSSVYFTFLDNNEYVVIDRTSEIAGRLGIQQQFDAAGGWGETVGLLNTNPGVPGLEDSNLWALPLQPEFLPGLNMPDVPDNAPAFWPVAIDQTAADPVISRVDRELKLYGTATARIPITDENSDQLSGLIARLKSEGVMVDGARVGDRPDVEQDIPEGVELLSVSDGNCGPHRDDWPMPLADVQEIITYNRAVMENAGVTSPNRASILIVDSGLPEVLAQHQDFRLFLKPDLSRALRRGYFWTRVTDLDGKQHCDPGLGNRLGASPFGFVSNVSERACNATLPIGGLEPVMPEPMPLRYEPDHGGFVGVLAAGGPGLIHREFGLSSSISVGFARIMSLENNKLQSSAADVSSSIEYARDNDYDIVNMSLAFQFGVSTAAKNSILCFVSPSGVCGDVTGRLIVAAAGNIRTPLSQSSSSFPASVATDPQFRGTDRIIVVGGIERDSNGAVQPWSDSAFHKDYVDILAPSSGVVSFDGGAKSACMNGTSTSAPQVSFVAGMLFSMGYTEGRRVRERILATAKHHGPQHQSFFNSAKAGRVLDVPAALDIFSDLIFVKQPDGGEQMLRGRLVPESDDLKGVVIQICHRDEPGLIGDAGRKDANQFSLWRSLNDETAEVWANGFAAAPDNECVYDGNTNIHFVEHGDEDKQSFRLSELARIVPSHFRRALEEFSDN